MRGLNGGRRTRGDVVVVVPLVAVAIGLRAPGLGPSSLWIDDAWVAFAHRAGYADLTEIGLSAPGFSLLLKIWFEIVGFTEVSAQVVPFAAAIVAPPLAYVILRYRVGAAVALAGASWLLLAPVHVEYSTRVKQYSTEVVLALLLVHLSWRLVDEPTERRTWRRLALLSTVAVLISFPLASVAGAGCLVAAFVGLRRTGKLDTMFLWLVVPTLTTAAWFVIVIRHRQYPGLRAFWEPHYIQTDAGIRIAVESALDRVREFLEQTSPLPVVPSAIIVALGFVLVLHRRPPLFVVTALPLAAAVTTEDSVLEISDHLPAEAAEAILELAVGGHPEIHKSPADDENPFDHPDAQRRFRVMNNVEELERALDYPWDKWTVFLHPAQRALVEREFSGPARISGSAGTGKTIVALHRAVFLARTNPDARVLLSSFSDTLANALRTKLKRLISNEPRLAERGPLP